MIEMASSSFSLALKEGLWEINLIRINSRIIIKSKKEYSFGCKKPYLTGDNKTKLCH